jgi:hypothetical protein
MILDFSAICLLPGESSSSVPRIDYNERRRLSRDNAAML